MRIRKLGFQKTKTIIFLVISGFLLIIDIISLVKLRFFSTPASPEFIEIRNVIFLGYLLYLFYFSSTLKDSKNVFWLLLGLISFETVFNLLVKGILFMNFTSTLILSVFGIAFSLKSIFGFNIGIWLRKLKPVHVFILLVLIYFFSYFYFGGFKSQLELYKTPYNVLGDEVKTWLLGGYDQSAYFRMTKRIISGEWFGGEFAGDYRYGLGYPVLGAIFYHAYPANPFLPVNLLIYSVSFLLFYKVLSKKLGVAYALAATLLQATQSDLVNYNEWYMREAIFPVNNIIPLLVSFVYFYFTLGRKLSAKKIFISGLLLGLVFAARYGDIIYFTPLIIFLILNDGVAIRSILPRLLLFSSGFLLVAAPVLWSHYLFFGNPFHTYFTYAFDRNGIYFHPFDLETNLTKFVEMFLFPFINIADSGRNVSSFLSPMVYAILLPFGVIYLFRKEKWAAVASLAFVVSNILYFTSTEAVSAVQIKFDSLRYFIPTLPFIALFSFSGLKLLLRSEGVFDLGNGNSPLHKNSQNKQDDNLLTTDLLGRSRKSKHVIPVVCSTAFIISWAMSIGSLVDKDFINKMRNFITGNFSAEISYKGHDTDVVTFQGFPNYGSDGKDDLSFEVDFKSLYPFSLYSVKVEETGGDRFWDTLKESSLGVGLINRFGNNITYRSGDEWRYKMYYLTGAKRVTVSIPYEDINPTTEKFLNFVFNTSRGSIEKSISFRI